MSAWSAHSRRSVLGLLPLAAIVVDEAVAEKKKKKGKKKNTTYAAGDIINCDDFATQSEAQRFFKQCGGPTDDRYGLDSDNDGVASEHLP